jgi:hypothetical protein
MITGKPGAGKTYLAVHHLVENYFKFDKDTESFHPTKDVTIITNIEDLKLPHLNVDDVLKKSGKTIEQFMARDYQEKLTEKKGPIVYLFDEAQRYFRAKFYNTAVFDYFEYHRHLGHDIYLISQDKYRLCRTITDLAETEQRAVQRSLSFLGEMKYKNLVAGDMVGTKAIRPRKEIFALYKSMTHNETEKVRFPMRNFFIGLIIAGLGAGFIGYKFIFPNARKGVDGMISQDATNPTPIIPTSHQMRATPAVFETSTQSVPLHGVIFINDVPRWAVHPVTGRLASINAIGYPIRTPVPGLKGADRLPPVFVELPTDLAKAYRERITLDHKRDSSDPGPQQAEMGLRKNLRSDLSRAIQ